MVFGEKKESGKYFGASSKASAPKPSYTPFTTSERAKISAALEDSLLRKDSFCCLELELKKEMLANEQLRSLMLRVGAVNGLLDDLEVEGMIDSVSRNELGVLVLTPKYFAQFQDPQKMRSLGANDHHVSDKYPKPLSSTAGRYAS